MDYELVDDIVAEVVEVIEFEMTSECTCEVFDEDTDSSYPSAECFGCWDDDKDNFRFAVVNPWLERNGWDDDTLIYVFSGNMNWNRVAGWTNIRASEVIDALTLRGDFRLRYKLDGKQLTCVRSSHDEMGALFTFSKAEEDAE
ncbi:MAG: hypothetical protein EBS31_07210 [Burkholderiaceae bacterium]|nr:hypothetical protein [Burkholderiaceae bacterium]